MRHKARARIDAPGGPAAADDAAPGTPGDTPTPNEVGEPDVIERSHSRCLDLGITETLRPSFDRPGLGDWRDALERNDRLRQHAVPVMETLYAQIANSHSMVVLTDAGGLIVHSLGDDDFLERASRVALQPGVSWSEQEKGTNAIGTALVEKRPTLVHADQHFLVANHFLTCSATPIQAPDGGIVGVLDVTGDARTYHQHTMALVRMSATMIENNLLIGAASSGFRLHFHTRPEFIHTLAESIVTFDDDGRCRSANRAAQEQLGLAPTRLADLTFPTLFGIAVAAVHDHVRTEATRPMALYLRNEVPVFAKVEILGRGRRTAVPGIERMVDAPPPTLSAPVAPATIPGPINRSPATDAALAIGIGGGLDELDTGDPQMNAVLSKVRRVIGRGIPFLILGETGSGKELLARAIHRDSPRAGGPFVAVNCASIPENLIESELFGYDEGAFTGARRRGYIGRILQAHRGTLFLDEIGDMPISLQARLLRVLQDRTVVPLGSQRTIPADIALVCATHRNLRELVAAGTFREDLYYRLNGLAVRLPPLRDRIDLPALIDVILRSECGNTAKTIGDDVRAMLLAYRWPGNIRQLANLLRTACAMAGDEPVIDIPHLPDDFLEEIQAGVASMPAGPATPVAPAAAPSVAAAPSPATAAAAPEPDANGAGSNLEQIAMAAIEQALKANDGNVSLTARQLGISRNTIYRKLRQGGRAA